jgi:RNA polymerase sigma factor (sigma-70 family)
VITDSALLRQYVKDGSEAAFTELVHRYGALVYSAALRSVGGQGQLAEEITQDVFILLVRKAPMLVRHETLAGWLHTTTRYVALRALHRQRQRETREQEAVAMQILSTPEIQWEQLRHLLDEAVGQLDDRDRNAVLLRYPTKYERRPRLWHPRRQCGKKLGKLRPTGRTQLGGRLTARLCAKLGHRRRSHRPRKG